MNKLHTALLASTFLAVAAAALPAQAIGVGGGPPPAPTVSDFVFSSTTTSFGGGAASGYFTLSNNTADWNVVGLQVDVDPRASFDGAFTTREDWNAESFGGAVVYNASFVSVGSGEGNYVDPLGPGQTESGFFWSESFVPLVFLDPPYFIDLFNLNTGDSLTLEGSFDSVASNVPEPSTLSALITGLLGLTICLGMVRRRSSLVARRVGR